MYVRALHCHGRFPVEEAPLPTVAARPLGSPDRGPVQTLRPGGPFLAPSRPVKQREGDDPREALDRQGTPLPQTQDKGAHGSTRVTRQAAAAAATWLGARATGNGRRSAARRWASTRRMEEPRRKQTAEANNWGVRTFGVRRGFPFAAGPAFALLLKGKGQSRPALRGDPLLLVPSAQPINAGLTGHQAPTAPSLKRPRQQLPCIARRSRRPATPAAGSRADPLSACTHSRTRRSKT